MSFKGDKEWSEASKEQARGVGRARKKKGEEEEEEERRGGFTTSAAHIELIQIPTVSQQFSKVNLKPYQDKTENQKKSRWMWKEAAAQIRRNWKRLVRTRT